MEGVKEEGDAPAHRVLDAHTVANPLPATPDTHVVECDGVDLLEVPEQDSQTSSMFQSCKNDSNAQN